MLSCIAWHSSTGVRIVCARASSGSVTEAASRTQLYVGLQFCSSGRATRFLW